MLNRLCVRKYKRFTALNVHVGPNLPDFTSLYLSPAPADQDLPPSLLHTVSVQMVQSSCWANPLIACRIAAFSLLTILTHNPDVFALQSKKG